MFHSTKHAANYQLTKFLKLHKRQNHNPCSHVSFVGGAWSISDDELSEFHKLYSDAAQYFSMYIMELPQHKAKPIIIDFDFHFLGKESVRSINVDVASLMVDKLMLILFDIFGEGHDYTCVVLQRPEQYEKGCVWSDGLHIQFPYIVCEPMYHTIVRDMFISTCDMKFGCCNDIESIYDKNNVTWCLYQSTKPEVKSYDILKIYNNDTLDAYYRNNKLISILEFVNLLSIRNKNHMIIQSVRGSNFYKKSSGIRIVDLNLPKIEYNVTVIIELLQMLNRRRVDNYSDWIRIGIILHYCYITNTNTSIDFYNVFLKWSQISSKYRIGDCDDLWKWYADFICYAYTFEDLYNLARIDNPILFQEFVATNPTFEAFILQKNDF